MRSAALLTLLLAGAGPLSAQVPDTLPPDSLRADAVDETARFLAAQEQAVVRVPVMPRLALDGPLPPMSRTVLGRDSLEWATAETLGDLLQRVPGVFLWRGGWIGRPESPNYQGRGAAAVEYVLDGVPYLAVGPDSLSVDPSLFALSLLDRVEIERWPGLLRVYLFTSRHDRLAPRSRIAIASGDRDIARYQGSFERRTQTGPALAIGADVLDAPTGSGASSDFDRTQYWVQGGFVPHEGVGLQYQLMRLEPDRAAFLGGSTGTDTLGAGLTGQRSDVQIRGFWRPWRSGFGPRLDLVWARTSWTGGGVEQEVSQLGAQASWRTPTFSLAASAFRRSDWVTVDLRARAGWAPASGVSASLEVVHHDHPGDRATDWLGGRLGLRLPLGLDVAGSARVGTIIATPAIFSDTAQTLRDFQVMAGWHRRWLDAEVGWSRTSAFQPRGFQPYLRVPTLGPSPATEWLTASVRLSPLSWITLEGWYSDPRTTLPDGLPPTHSLASATLRSKFLRTFPSGIFDLKLQVSMETWGTGVIGRDATGAPITLRGATFFRNYLQMQFGSLSIYFDRVNLRGTRLTHVPGFTIPAFGSTFGVRWEFLN